MSGVLGELDNGAYRWRVRWLICSIEICRFSFFIVNYAELPESLSDLKLCNNGTKLFHIMIVQKQTNM